MSKKTSRSEAELALSSRQPSITEANWSFHRALYRASDWTRGLAITERLHAASAPYVRLYTQELGGAAESDAEHLALLALCRKGNADQADRLLQLHLDHAERALVDFLSPSHPGRRAGGGTEAG
ncbi:MAG: FCD domain-containing protein [Acidobacteriota bacterium]